MSRILPPFSQISARTAGKWHPRLVGQPSVWHSADFGRTLDDSETIPAPCGSPSDGGGHLAVYSANRKLTQYPKTGRRIRCGGHKPMRDGGSPPLRSTIELLPARGYSARSWLKPYEFGG